MKYLPIALGLAMAGCSRTPPPEPVKVMVPVPCISTMPAKPVYPEVNGDAGLFERVQTLLADRELRIAYEGQLEAALSACD